MTPPPFAEGVPTDWQATGALLGGLAALAGVVLLLFKVYNTLTDPLRHRIQAVQDDCDRLRADVAQRAADLVRKDEALAEKDEVLAEKTRSWMHRMANDMHALSLKLEVVPQAVSEQIRQAMTPFLARQDRHGEVLAEIRGILNRKGHEDTEGT